MPKRENSKVQGEVQNKEKKENKIEEKPIKDLEEKKEITKGVKQIGKGDKSMINKELSSKEAATKQIVSKENKKNDKSKKIEVEKMEEQAVEQKVIQVKKVNKQEQEQDKKKDKRKRLDRSREPKAIINGMGVGRPNEEQDLIKDTGLLEAYEMLLRAICKYGLPTGDIYQFAAQQIEKYERKKRAKQLKIKAEMQIRKVAMRKEQN